ncbi:hypothetical protein BH09PLA1_BH09PLA1_25890 [soil metagenome]
MPAKPNQIGSVRQLSRELKLSHTAVLKWLADPRWKFGGSPWSRTLLPAMKRWQALNLADDPAADSDAGASGQISVRDLAPDKRAKMARVLVQTQRDQVKLQIEKGQVHRVDECERRRLRQIHAVKQELLGAHESMPADTPPSIREWVRLRMEATCHHFAGTTAVA